MELTLVDSGVWIDYLGGPSTTEAALLDDLLGAGQVLMGDLILMEVLQGVRSERQFTQVRDRLSLLPFVVLGGRDVAIVAAGHYRDLRARGITIHKAIDTLIATRCIIEGWPLLHRDRDFEPFTTHLGLRPALRLS